MIILYMLIVAHFLADFTFQPADLALKKTEKFSFLFIHSVIYVATLSIAIFLFLDFSSAILLNIVIAVSHFLIDWVRKTLDRKFRKKAVFFISFLVDQILHISILVLLFYIFNLSTKSNQLYDCIQKWGYLNKLIIYVLIFVIVWDPAAVFIKKLFAYIINENACADEENDPQIGRIIGKLERVIIAALVLCNQFGAIGFVLAAKSIARFRQLEDKIFAEKYLVGTLTSTCIAFITAIILRHLL